MFAHILQHYHDFESNVAIFFRIVKEFTQTYSFGGKMKLIICEIRHELMVFSLCTLFNKMHFFVCFLKMYRPLKGWYALFKINCTFQWWRALHFMPCINREFFLIILCKADDFCLFIGLPDEIYKKSPDIVNQFRI